MEQKRYRIKDSWIFNLESMNDKLMNLFYDAQDGKVQFPVKIAGKTAHNEDDIRAIMNEAAELEIAAKSGKVTGKQYGRISEMVEWRITVRYNACLAAGMSIREAELCFADW